MDEWLKQLYSEHNENRARVLAEQDRALKAHLKLEFDVPDEFMDLAVRIWWDGKED